jgi:hypothetical protein
MTSLTSAYCTAYGMSDVFVRLTPIKTAIAKKILRYDAYIRKQMVIQPLEYEIPIFLAMVFVAAFVFQNKNTCNKSSR